MINVLLWSHLISFLSVAMLYPFRLYARNSAMLRLWSLVFLLPALVSSCWTLQLIFFARVNVVKVLFSSPIPLSGLIKLDAINSVLLTCSVLLMILLTVLLPARKIADNLSMTSTTLFLITAMSIAADQFIKLVIFSLGSILITFMILNEEDDWHAIKSSTSDFFVQRASDIIAFVVLVTIAWSSHPYILTPLTEGSISIESRMFYFFALTLKIVSSSYVLSHIPIRLDDVYSNLVPRKIYYVVGSLILLLQFSKSFPVNDTEKSIFLVMAVVILIATVAWMIIHRAHTGYYEHAINSITCFALIAICLGCHIMALAAVCFVLLFGPHAYLGGIQNRSLPEQTSHASELAWPIVVRLFLELPLRGLYFMAKVFVTFFSDVYAGILLYQLPRIFLGMLQIPLRLLNNGNIQRSLIFVSIMVFSYFVWWGYR
ncbi:MAG TPA: hypothetical protein VEL47_07485 [Myxococcota bacterium]|nr:hypothetical protein [Myxococcota bacterium]